MDRKMIDGIYTNRIKILDTVFLAEFGLSKTVELEDTQERVKVFVPLIPIDLMGNNEMIFECRQMGEDEVILGACVNMSRTGRTNTKGNMHIDRQMFIQYESIKEITVQDAKDVCFYIKLCYLPEFYNFNRDLIDLKISKVLDKSLIWKNNKLENAINSQLILRISGSICEDLTYDNYLSIFESKMNHLYSRSNIGFAKLEYELEARMTSNLISKIRLIYYKLK